MSSQPLIRTKGSELVGNTLGGSVGPTSMAAVARALIATVVPNKTLRWRSRNQAVTRIEAAGGADPGQPACGREMNGCKIIRTMTGKGDGRSITTRRSM